MHEGSPVSVATGLSFWFEMKANKEFAILNQVNDEEPVQVWRNGAVTQIPRKYVVVGDIVVVNTGDEIPADGRLLEAASMSVDESTLTGEPSCMKTTDESHFDPEATYRSSLHLEPETQSGGKKNCHEYSNWLKKRLEGMIGIYICLINRDAYG